MLTNIGRDRENDIVIDDPDVAPFQAMLDHRQKPYQLLMLGEAGQTDGSPINGARALHHLDQFQFGAYTLILVEDQSAPSASGSPPVVIPPHQTEPVGQTPTIIPAAPPEPLFPSAPTPPARPAAGQSPPTRPEPPPAAQANRSLMPAVVPVPVPGGVLGPESGGPSSPIAGGVAQGALGPTSPLPPDFDDDEILIEISENEWVVDVTDSAYCEITITNTGDLVATFNVMVEGLDNSWVYISEPSVNISKGRTAVVTISITPPKSPTSYAGAHNFAIIVRSPTYNYHYSQRGATIVINPYYKFSVTELVPRAQTISWFKRYGDTVVTVDNEGNSAAPFHVEGSDAEQACFYEFDIPGEAVALTGQAPLTIPPVSAADIQRSVERQQPLLRSEIIPVRIIPQSRPLALRKRLHRFSITVTPLDGHQTPLALPGELRQKPLLNVFVLLLLALLLLLLCGSGVWFTFGPHIDTFTVDDEIRGKSIDAGEEVRLGWEASSFANLRIVPDIGGLEDSVGEIEVAPEKTTTYVLEASNILTTLFPFFPIQTEERLVRVVPIEPSIRVFEALPDSIVTGEEVVLSWDVTDAEELVLTTDGFPEELPTTEHRGERIVSPNQDTNYGLEARNIYGDTSGNVAVAVVTPTGTPVPTPQVSFFNVSPNQIIQGESVTLNWSVLGADSVTINPIGPVPPEGPVSHMPFDTTLYTLLAVKEGAPSVNLVQRVVVLPPTGTPSPTPTPQAPVIEFFTVSPDTLVEGDSTELELTWSVLGDTTKIEITGPDIGATSGLDKQGSLPVTVDGATLFILTAFNGDLSASQTVQVSADDPTPTPEPTETPIPPPRIIAYQPRPDGVNVTCTQLGNSNWNCNVKKGATLKVDWSVSDDAERVNIRVLGDVTEFQATDQEIDPGQSKGYTGFRASDGGDYPLKAFNASPSSPATRSIFVTVLAPDIPSPPLNFTGEAVTDTNTSILTHTLQWDAPAQNEEQVIGYRVYYQQLGETGFESHDIPDDPGDPLDDPDDPQYTIWHRRNGQDGQSFCGDDTINYFVVALYEDINGDPVETAAGSPSWNSETRPGYGSCP